MAKCLVHVFCAIVLLFVAETIEESSIQYVSEIDLKIDPTKCSNSIAGYDLKLKDYIARHSNGTSVITVYGQSRSGSLFFTFGKNGITNNYISIRAFEATIKSYWMETLYKTSYHEDPLNLSEFVPIEIQLEFGNKLRIKISLPNGAELVIIDKTSNFIEEIYLTPWSKWYFNCPASKVRNTESPIFTESISSESTKQNSSGF